MSPLISEAPNHSITTTPIATSMPHVRAASGLTDGILVANDEGTGPKSTLLVRRRKRWARRVTH